VDSIVGLSIDERDRQNHGKDNLEGIEHFAQAFGELVKAMESVGFVDPLCATFLGLDPSNSGKASSSRCTSYAV